MASYMHSAFCTLLFDSGVVFLPKIHGNCISHILFDSFKLLKPQNTEILQAFLKTVNKGLISRPM